MAVAVYRWWWFQLLSFDSESLGVYDVPSFARWLLARGDRTWNFDCICKFHVLAGGGEKAFFLIFKGCNKGCLFMGGNKSYEIAGLTKHIILIAAGLAQSVERLTAEGKVAGSIPGVGPILRVLK